MQLLVVCVGGEGGGERKAGDVWGYYTPQILEWRVPLGPQKPDPAPDQVMI